MSEMSEIPPRPPSLAIGRSLAESVEGHSAVRSGRHPVSETAKIRTGLLRDISRICFAGPGAQKLPAQTFQLIEIVDWPSDDRRNFRRRVGSALEPEPLAAIGAAHDALPPGAVVEIPAHGVAQALLERTPRPPAELARDLGGIDGVALVVARPVGHELDQLGVRAVDGVGQHVVEQGADRAYHVDV